MIQFRCNSCHQSIKVDDKHAGKNAKCPKCQTPFRVPSPQAMGELADPLGDPFAPSSADPLNLLGAAHSPPPASSKVPAPIASVAGPRCPWCKAPLRSPTEPICGKCGLAIPQTTQPSVKKAAKGAADPMLPNYSSAREGTAILAVQRQAPVASVGRSIAGLVVGAGVAFVACLIWLAIAFVSGFEFGLLAWGIGGLVGFAAGIIAKNPNPIFCFLVAGLSGMSILGAKLIMTFIVMLASIGVEFVKEMGQLGPENWKISLAVQDEMLAEGLFEGQQKQIVEERVRLFFANSNEGPATQVTDPSALEQASLAIDGKVDARIKEMTKQDKEAALGRARQRYPGWIEFEYHYQAILESLIKTGALTDAALVAHAQSELKKLDGEFDSDYYETVAERELDRRGTELRSIVSEKKQSMSDRQLDEALRNSIKNHPNWIPNFDEYIAVLEKMQRENQFTGALAKHAQTTLDQTLNGDPFGEPANLDFDLQKQRDDELAVRVNEQFVVMDAEQRNALIQDLKSRFPLWNSLTGGADAELEELDQALKEAGADGTFWGSFKQVFHVLDILWLFLGVSTAFAVAYKQGGGG